MLEPWAIGVIICVLGSATSNIGWSIQKYSHMRNQTKPEHLQRPYYKQRLWLVGFVIYAFGNLGDFVALAFAAQSLVAPLGSVTLVVNAVMSPWLLKETITTKDLGAIAVIIVGDVLIVLFASHEETHHSLDNLVHYFGRPAFVCFLLVTCAFGTYLAWKKDQLDAMLDPESPDYYDPGSDSKEFISPHVMHPYTYAALAGIVGGLSVLLAKCVAELVKVTIEGNRGQFTDPVAWLFAFLLLATCIAQVHWINQGLERYDSVYIVPVFHVHWNVWSVIGGISFFDEFHTFEAKNYCLFLLGVSFIMVGVFLLSQREMANATFSKNELVDQESEGLMGEDSGARSDAHDGSNRDSSNHDPSSSSKSVKRRPRVRYHAYDELLSRSRVVT